MMTPHGHAAKVLFAIALIALAGAHISPALAADTGAGFDWYSNQVLKNKLFTDSPPEFEEPPWMTDEKPEVPARTNGSQDDLKGSVSVAAGPLLNSQEHGEATDFSGTSGTGTEMRLGFGRASGWCLALALSQVTDELYSTVDDASSAITRYMLGMERSWRMGKSMRIATGGGVAWNLVDIDADDTDRDITGLGGYLELRMDFPLAKRVVLGVGGRAIMWQGEDGYGNTGDELSTTMAADLGFRF